MADFGSSVPDNSPRLQLPHPDLVRDSDSDSSRVHTRDRPADQVPTAGTRMPWPPAWTGPESHGVRWKVRYQPYSATGRSPPGCPEIPSVRCGPRIVSGSGQTPSDSCENLLRPRSAGRLADGSPEFPEISAAGRGPCRIPSGDSRAGGGNPDL